MKTPITLLSILACAGFVNAQCSEGSCDTPKEGCCATACESEAVTTSGDVVYVAVDGMTCGGCSGKLTKALDGMEGVTVKSVCHKSGTATLVKTDKVDEKAIAKTVVDTGFTVKK